jgi:hypothetical protein
VPPRSIRRKACASRKAIAAAAVIAVVFAQAVAVAASATWPEEQFNPQPLADDVVLPMPCGGAMAFRRVVIPADGPLDDRLVVLGAADAEHGYAESSRPAFIAGSFSAGRDGRYMLIGKYEVSALQYQALGTSCPQPSADGRLAQTDVSWIDAVGFADRYTQWLQKNAADKLPREDGEPGFVRLPTETEWEFAARGGLAVAEADFRERTFPMPEGLAAYVWFAGSQSANAKVQRIGLLKPNPLGLFDILGNVDEIAFEPFRLNKLDRLHGQAGGFVVRGGNFTTAEEDMRSAYRHEVPFYRGGEPRRSKTSGFRLAVAAPVITSRGRLQAIETAWADLGAGAPATEAKKTPALGEEPLADPIKELAAIAEAAGEANMKKRLQNLELTFRATFLARDEQRDRAAKARLRLGTFLCQKIKDDGLPIDRLKEVHRACVAARGAQHERCQDQKRTIDQEEAKQWENLRYYADTIVTVVDDYDDAVIGRQLTVLKGELAARGVQALSPVADLYARQVQQYRKDKAINRAAWLAQCKGG